MIENEFIDSLEKQAEYERKVADSLTLTSGMTENRVVRFLLNTMILDSRRHAEILEMVLNLEKEQFSYQGVDAAFKAKLEAHIKIESDMLKGIEKIIEKTESRGAKFLLQNIASDERRHHAVLERLVEIAESGVKPQDDKWWDFVYRYSQLKT